MEDLPRLMDGHFNKWPIIDHFSLNGHSISLRILPVELLEQIPFSWSSLIFIQINGHFIWLQSDESAFNYLPPVSAKSNFD
jgi:hypothetical protein